MAKPTIKILSSGRRQFSLAFKLMVLGIIANCDRGTRKKICDQFKLSQGLIYYWQQQDKDQHFKLDRAVAFSRQPEGTMITPDTKGG